MIAPNNLSILERTLKLSGGDLPPDIARTVLGWRFTESDQKQLTELLAKNRTSGLTAEETSLLDWYLLLGDFLTILQAKARFSLQRASSAA